MASWICQPAQRYLQRDTLPASRVRGLFLGILSPVQRAHDPCVGREPQAL